jgi:hypothetical protein
MGTSANHYNDFPSRESSEELLTWTSIATTGLFFFFNKFSIGILPRCFHTVRHIQDLNSNASVLFLYTQASLTVGYLRTGVTTLTCCNSITCFFQVMVKTICSVSCTVTLDYIVLSHGDFETTI